MNIWLFFPIIFCDDKLCHIEHSSTCPLVPFWNSPGRSEYCQDVLNTALSSFLACLPAAALSSWWVTWGQDYGFLISLSWVPRKAPQNPGAQKCWLIFKLYFIISHLHGTISQDIFYIT